MEISKDDSYSQNDKKENPENCHQISLLCLLGIVYRTIFLLHLELLDENTRNLLNLAKNCMHLPVLMVMATVLLHENAISNLLASNFLPSIIVARLIEGATNFS